VRSDGRLVLVATEGQREYTLTYPHAFPGAAATLRDGALDDTGTRTIDADAPLPAGARAIDRIEHDRPAAYMRLRRRFTVLCTPAWSELRGGSGGELEMGSDSGPTLAALRITGVERPSGPFYESRALAGAFSEKRTGWWVRGPAPDWSDDNESLVSQLEKMIAEHSGLSPATVRTELARGRIAALAYSHPRRLDQTQWLFARRTSDGDPEIGTVEEYRPFETRQRAPFADELRFKSVAVVGCGALGWAIALSLARAGVGWFSLFDRDELHAGNLPRLPARPSWVGMPKVVALAAEIIDAALESAPLPVIGYIGADLGARALLDHEVDLLVDATADPRSPTETNLAAVAGGRPALYAWTNAGVVAARLFRVMPGRTPCYQCLREAEIEAIPGERPVTGWTEQFVWNGANFNLEMVASAATRMAVRTLLGHDVDESNPDHVVLRLGGPVPIAQRLEYARDPECEVCR
jgi:NAD(P)-dependent dehydrogenase (short-subunit alcohol dehydrogenase family)